LTFSAKCLIISAMRAVAFVLVPKFSMIALYGAMEPLRVANRFKADAFSWRFLSVDGEPVAASNGIPVSVSGPVSQVGSPDLTLFCASYEPQAAMTRAVLGALHKLARKGGIIGGMDTAPFLMAEAGVLDGHRATCHWESLPGFRESYPSVEAGQSLYVIDRKRMTCAGGAAAIDMMLAWIGQIHGKALSVQVADQLVHFRSGAEEARAPAGARYGTSDARVLAVIAAMEANVEEPLRADALAAAAGVSSRQLERLFAAQLGKTPARFYLDLRLERAERLITYSEMSMRDVALATGFSSPALFSRAFREKYGKPPSSISMSARQV